MTTESCKVCGGQGGANGCGYGSGYEGPCHAGPYTVFPKVYFGFAIADSMFKGNCTLTRSVLTVEQAKDIIEADGVVSCLNPSHKATIDAMKVRYGIEVTIPEKAPQVTVGVGEFVIVMSVRGLPRLDATRHEYTEEEISKATFEFALWENVAVEV